LLPFLAVVLDARESIHNISTLLGKQLVFKLKIWICLLELLELLPSSVGWGAAHPANTNLPMAPNHSSHLDSSWRGHHSTMDNGRQGHHGRLRVADELLEEEHVKDIVDLGEWWQLKTIGHGDRRVPGLDTVHRSEGLAWR